MNQNILDTLCLFAEEKQPEIKNFRICAAVVHKHRDIVSLGFPRRKSHPLQKKFGSNKHAIFLHAEVDALIKAMRITTIHPKEHTLYVARIKRKGAFDDSFIVGDALPCKGCKDFIKSFGDLMTVTTLG